MLELTDRQANILRFVVQSYVSTPEPVSSKILVEAHGLNVSSATVRNELAALEELGLLAQPHTSAGRVPTEAGYRYVVAGLLESSQLSPAEREAIRARFNTPEFDMDQWLRLSASVLARTAHSAALITPPLSSKNVFKHLEIVITQGRLALMVLVLEGGHVRQQMVTLDEPVAQETLSQIANRFSQTYTGLTAAEIQTRLAQINGLERDLAQRLVTLLHQTDLPRTEVISDGLANIFNESETEPEGVRQTLRMLEEDALLADILTLVVPTEVGDVQVMIAGEGRWEELSHCSIVLTSYGVSGQATGAMGILGPMRMRYGRAISVVRYVSELTSRMLGDVYGHTDGDA